MSSSVRLNTRPGQSTASTAGAAGGSQSGKTVARSLLSLNAPKLRRPTHTSPVLANANTRLSGDDNFVPMIRTSKRWVLPPRPKPGRKRAAAASSHSCTASKPKKPAAKSQGGAKCQKEKTPPSNAVAKPGAGGWDKNRDVQKTPKEVLSKLATELKKATQENFLLKREASDLVHDLRSLLSRPQTKPPSPTAPSFAPPVVDHKANLPASPFKFTDSLPAQPRLVSPTSIIAADDASPEASDIETIIQDAQEPVSRKRLRNLLVDEESSADLDKHDSSNETESSNVDALFDNFIIIKEVANEAARQGFSLDLKLESDTSTPILADPETFSNHREKQNRIGGLNGLSRPESTQSTVPSLTSALSSCSTSPRFITSLELTLPHNFGEMALHRLDLSGVSMLKHPSEAQEQFLSDGGANFSYGNGDIFSSFDKAYHDFNY